MAKIMAVQDFKDLTKEKKTECLKELRLVYSDKEIRDHWGMKYDAYNYYLMTLGLKAPYGKKEETVADRLRNKNSGQNGNAQANTNVKINNKKVIEADFHVIPELFEEKVEEKQLALPETAPVPTLAASEPQAMMNFPAVVGNVAQIRKRLEAFLTVLECEGDDAVFQMKFVIDRK